MKDYHDVAEFLHKLGWTSPNDAQWSELKKALPQLHEMIAEAMKPRAFLWMHLSFDNVDDVSVWQMNENGCDVVVPWVPRGYRDPKQAAREELVSRNLIPAPTRSKSGGQHYNEEGYRLYQL